MSTNANQSSLAGVYDVNATGGSDDDYHFVYHGSALTIGEAAQHIDSLEIASEAVYGEAALQLEATATSDLPVSFVSSDPDVLEVNGTQLKGKDFTDGSPKRRVGDKTKVLSLIHI